LEQETLPFPSFLPLLSFLPPHCHLLLTLRFKQEYDRGYNLSLTDVYTQRNLTRHFRWTPPFPPTRPRTLHRRLPPPPASSPFQLERLYPLCPPGSTQFQLGLLLNRKAQFVIVTDILDRKIPVMDISKFFCTFLRNVRVMVAILQRFTFFQWGLDYFVHIVAGVCKHIAAKHSVENTQVALLSRSASFSFALPF